MAMLEELGFLPASTFIICSDFRPPRIAGEFRIAVVVGPRNAADILDSETYFPVDNDAQRLILVPKG